MGSVAFDFLTESFLFDPSSLEEAYTHVSEEDLKSELRRYREHIISNIDILRHEITENKSSLKVFSSRDHFQQSHLIQSALYLDQVVLIDPVFRLSRIPSVTDICMGSVLGHSEENAIDRKELADVISGVKSLTPMVASDYVKFFPGSYDLKSNEPIPLLYSNTGFADSLPREIISKYRDCTDVRSVGKVGDRLIVDESLHLGRRICVMFGTDEPDQAMVFGLFKHTIKQVDNDRKKVIVQVEIPEDDPSIESFSDWVNQSVNQAARNHFSQLMEVLQLSTSLGASYLTGSEFAASLSPFW